MSWKIVCEPVGRNPGTAPAGRSKTKGRNEGGIVVYLTGVTGKQEVARVAFERKNSTHPDVPFEDQLRQTIETARTAITSINELLTDSQELQ